MKKKLHVNIRIASYITRYDVFVQNVEIVGFFWKYFESKKFNPGQYDHLMIDAKEFDRQTSPLPFPGHATIWNIMFCVSPLRQ